MLAVVRSGAFTSRRRAGCARRASDAAGRSSCRPAGTRRHRGGRRSRRAPASAQRTRSAAGVKAAATGSSWSGWMQSLPAKPSPRGRFGLGGEPGRVARVGQGRVERRHARRRRPRQRRGAGRRDRRRCRRRPRRGAMPRSADRSSAPKHSAGSRAGAPAVVHRASEAAVSVTSAITPTLSDVEPGGGLRAPPGDGRARRRSSRPGAFRQHDRGRPRRHDRGEVGADTTACRAG